MTDLTNIFARSIKDLTLLPQLPDDLTVLDRVKVPVGNLPVGLNGCEALTVKQIKDLATIDLESKKANKIDVEVALSNLRTTANKFYPTLSEANNHLATMSVNDVVTIGEEANKGLWYKATANATTLTKSAYDPLTQANNYTNNKSSTTKAEAVALANKYTNLVFDAVPATIAPYVAQAEAAATAATISAGVFETPEAGVDPTTGVKGGKYFNVRSPSSNSYIDEYQNVGGVATPSGKSYPSSAYVQDIVNYTARPFSETKVYPINARVMLENGDIVKSTIANNTTNPNNDMVGWVRVGNVYQVDTVEELLNIQSPKDGDICNVSDDLRGGKFEYKASRASENNGGTVFNGWVRKYFGSVYLEWFCETDPSTTDCSTYLERALAVTKGVKAGANEFLFSGRVGIPDTDQSNIAERMVKIKGDGDTVFKIDCLAHGRATFTSASAKANPTTTENYFVGKVDVSGINFIGVNTTKGWALNEVNKNTTDIVFDGDRLYNTYIHGNNFSHLKNAVKCVQNRGLSVEGGNAYSQSLSLLRNHFYHMTKIVESDSLINFRFSENECERNYGGIYCKTKDIAVATSVVIRINDNLFEGGGQFLDLDGDVVAGSIFGNYFEYNTIEGILINKCQIRINGNTSGLLIGVNSFGGQIDFTGFNADYMDIKINDSAYNDSAKTDVFKSKPVLLSNHSTTRQLHSASRVIDIGNSSPYFLNTGFTKEAQPYNHFNSRALKAPQDNDVDFFRGIFNQPLNYTANNVGGVSTSTLSGSGQVIIAILDLSNMNAGLAKNKLSVMTGTLDANIELTKTGVTIGQLSVKVHVAIHKTGFGLADASQFDDVNLQCKLLSILQLSDVQVGYADPTAIIAKQFVEPNVSAVADYMGGGRFAIRLTNYLGAGVGTYGAPSDIYSSLTWQASVGCREVQDQIGTNVSFINYWW